MIFDHRCRNLAYGSTEIRCSQDNSISETDGQSARFSFLTTRGGAIAVCGMFIWFLLKKQTADEDARKTFLEHLEGKDQSTAKAIETQVSYMQQRDSQSKAIAESGHQALNSLTAEVAELRATISTKLERPA